MSRAIEGIALIGAAVGLEVVAFALASTGVGLAALPFLEAAAFSLAATGVAMEAAAIANALTANRGTNITTRQAAAARQIIYGQQRVGGVIIYRSTTGGKHDQMNYIIVLAGHVCDSIQNLYLDGRQVFFDPGSPYGITTHGGVAFGGNADGSTHYGPNGVAYNFGGLVYCEARYGDQPVGDVIGAVSGNDPIWSASSAGTPSAQGCCYVYLKIEYDTNTFPGEPEIKFTVNGKDNIYDPRSGTTGFTTNWALIAADVITDTQYGLGDNTVNQAQLIAAANVCDEQVLLGRPPSGQYESRYTTNHHYDTTTAPGSALEAMMLGAAGRLSRIGGEWYLWPAYWQGPSFDFDENSLTGPMEWEPYRSFSELINRVRGTYIAPNYPYNASGNLYDRNGYYNGMIQNNFPFAFQSTSFPEYAADTLHGFASDEYLTADGLQLPKEINLQTVLSVTQAQRVAKIVLLRNRQQGSGTFQASLGMWQMQPLDVMQFTFPQNGWLEKNLEVIGVSFKVEDTSGAEGTQSVRCEMKVQETDISVYEWSVTDELTVYDVPAYPSQTPYTPAPPTSMTLTSSSATALQTLDGVLHPRIEVQWTTPQDILTKQIQIQFQTQTGTAGPWLDAGLTDVSNNLFYISGIVSGNTYGVRIRSLRANGTFSVWEEIDGFVPGLALSVVGVLALAPGSLIGEGFTDGTAGIIVSPFTAVVGNASVSCLPSGDVSILGLVQQQLYYVYYIDPTFAGGNITPIATQTASDFLNKPGYFLIDSIVTPYQATTGGGGSPGARYNPSHYVDNGSQTTTSPTAAYDGDTSTFASCGSRWRAPAISGADPTLTTADIIYEYFPVLTSTVGMQLYVSAAFTIGPNIGSLPTDVAAVAAITVAGTAIATLSTTTAKTTYTYSIPTGTNLSTLMVECTCASPQDTGDSTAGTQSKSATLTVYEIYIQ